MKNLAETKAQLIHNVRTLAKYATGTTDERKFHDKKISNGRVFVAYPRGGQLLFAPSRLAGYKNNSTQREPTLKERDGRVTNVQIIRILGKYHDATSPQYKLIDDAFKNYCRKFGIIPSPHPRARRYWLAGDLGFFRNKIYLSPDEIDTNWTVIEDAKTTVTVNKFERDRRARLHCIKYYDARCSVCELEFEKRYGGLGKDFIHVHHIVPIAKIGKAYRLNPIRDLRPVCPNCHAMLHLGDGRTLGIKELRAIFKKSLLSKNNNKC
ncbi:MAG: HNH endonuclease [Alphaproteobacteria bacterium]|nr:HNH endonuclease [Alphaproteobacteria bacterium]